AVVSARLAPACSWRGAGSACGTYRPPSGARPAAMAWLRFTAGAALRVEMKFIVDPSGLGATASRPAVERDAGARASPTPLRDGYSRLAPGLSSGATQAWLSRPAAANAACTAGAAASALARFSNQPNTLGPAPEMLAPIAPPSSIAALAAAKPGISAARRGS